jgi:hypothetical protein
LQMVLLSSVVLKPKLRLPLRAWAAKLTKVGGVG